MGVDVRLYVRDNVPEERLEHVNEWLMQRGVYGYNDEDYAYCEPPLIQRGRWSREHKNGVEWKTLYRYYGIGYERGHWPTIHNAIACIRAALPDHTVMYGGDHGFIPEATDELLDELWEHWLSDKGRNYYTNPVKLEGEDT